MLDVLKNLGHFVVVNLVVHHELVVYVPEASRCWVQAAHVSLWRGSSGTDKPCFQSEIVS